MPRWIDFKVDGWTGHFRSEPDLLCKCTLRPRCLVAFEGVNTGRRFLACHHEQSWCDFMLYVDKEHSPELARVLAAMWKQAVSDLCDLSDSEYEEIEKQVKKESEEDVAPAIAAIKSTCDFVSEKLEALAEMLDHLTYE